MHSTFSDSDTPAQPRERLSSFASGVSSEGETGTTNESFQHDAVNGLVDVLKDNGDFDTAKLEFMGLRLSYNATDHQIRRAIAVAFTKRISQIVEHENIGAPEAAAQTFGMSGVETFLNEVAIGSGKSEDDQVEFITCLQKDLVHRVNGGIVLAAISQKLYQMDVLEEDAFLRWWEESEELGEAEDKEMKRAREKTRVFIDWLKEAEAESSEEESD
jgi:translation initiation factor eIF-2B subunit epsilon